MGAFLALDAHDVRGLAAWFQGPYQAAVSVAGRCTRSTVPPERATQTPVSETVATAQAMLRSAILAASEPGASHLVAMLPCVVDVVSVRDGSGARGYAPRNQVCAPLRTRVLTLLIADYLTRPDEYLACAAQRATVGSSFSADARA